MKFLTKAWMQAQLKNFADRISDVFARKTETESHYAQKATQGILGHVKLSNSTAITTPGEYALDAVEKNASVQGTLANLIQQTNSNLADEIFIDVSSSWKDIFDSLNGKFNNNYGVGVICYYTPDHTLITPPPNSRENHIALIVNGYNKWRIVFDADVLNSRLCYSVFIGDEPNNWHELP